MPCAFRAPCAFRGVKAFSTPGTSGLKAWLPKTSKGHSSVRVTRVFIFRGRESWNLDQQAKEQTLDIPGPSNIVNMPHHDRPGCAWSPPFAGIQIPGQFLSFVRDNSDVLGFRLLAGWSSSSCARKRHVRFSHIGWIPSGA